MVLAEITIRMTRGNVTLAKKFETTTTTVLDVKQYFCDHHAKFNKAEKVAFRMKGNKIKKDDNNKTLSAIGIKKELVMFTLTSKVIGGSQEEEKGGNILNINRHRKLDKSDPDIKISNKECCVYFDKRGDRAEMPCGHAFSPEGMFATLKALITNNKYDYMIKCPAIDGCGKELDFDLCATIADLNKEEYLYILDKIEERSSPEIKACPHCDMDCERPEQLSMFRVNCTSCSGGDWCFMCAKPWTGGGFTVCGNKNCDSYEINIILAECDMKKTQNGGEVEIPELRACPNCTEFIEHEKDCKHIKCPNCAHEFCFACLKPKLSTGWQCGSYMNQCDIAPKQKF